MIFEKVVNWFINNYLNQFVENVKYSDIKIGLLKGNISLSNVKIKSSVVEKLYGGLGVEMAMIGKMNIKIPWTSGLYIPTTTIYVDGIYIIMSQPLVGTSADFENVDWQEKMRKVEILEATKKLRENAIENSQSGKKSKSFTEKFGIALIKSLQFTLTNIHIRYQHLPNSVGVFIKSLQLVSTDENWNLNDEKSSESEMDYKLIKVENFGVYHLDSDKPLNQYSDIEMTKSALNVDNFEPFCEKNNFYILKPVTLVLKSKLNSANPVDQNFLYPKFIFDLVFGEICATLTKNNCRFILNEIKFMNLVNQQNKYIHLKPTVTVMEAPKEWFKFAVKCVILNIQQHSNQWDIGNMMEYRKHYKKYIKLYKDKLCGKYKEVKDVDVLNKGLENCEKELTVFSIVLARKMAEIEARKTGLYPPKESKGWFSGWFGGGSQVYSTDKDLGEQLEGDLTPEEKDKMFSAIGYEDDIKETKYPSNYSLIKFKGILSRFQLTIKNDNNEQILQTIVDQFAVKVLVQNDGISFILDTDKFGVFGVIHKDEIKPSKIMHIPESKNILHLHMAKNPINDPESDYLVKLQAEGVDIIYDSQTINAIVKWFDGLNSGDLSSRVANVAASTLNLYKDKFNIQQVLNNSVYVNFNFSIKSARLIIPENGKYNPDLSYFSVNLGNFVVNSSKTERNDYKYLEIGVKEMIDKAYDKFQLKLVQFKLILNQPNGKSFDIIKPIKLELQLLKSIIPSLLEAPSIKCAAVLSSLDLDVSVEQLIEIVKMMASIPEIEFPESPLDIFENESVSNLQRDSIYYSMDSINELSDIDDFMSAKMSFVESNKSGSDSGSNAYNSEPKNENLETNKQLVNYTKFHFEFTIKVVKLTLREHVQMKEFDPNITTSLEIRNVDILFDINNHGQEASLFIESISSFYQNLSLKTPISNLIDTKSENMEKLVKIKLTLLSQQYIKEKNTNLPLAHLEFDFDYIHVNLHEPAILFIRNCYLSIYESILNYHNSEHQFTNQYYKYRLQNQQKDNESQESKSNVKNYIQNISDSFDVTRKLSTSLNIANVVVDYFQLATMNVTGFSTKVEMTNNETSLDIKLQDLKIINIEKNGCIYKNIFSNIEMEDQFHEGNLLSVGIVKYNDRPANEKFDVKVNIACAKVEIVFMGLYVKKLSKKLDIFKIDAELMSQLGEYSKSVVSSVDSVLVGFNVNVESPRLILPTGCHSTQALCAHLGSFSVTNDHSIGASIMDNISVILNDVSLYNIKYINPAVLRNEISDDDTNYRLKTLSTLCILEPIHAQVFIGRNMDYPKNKSLPQLNVEINVEECSLKVSHFDIKYVMDVWFNNMNEQYPGEKTKNKKQHVSFNFKNVEHANEKNNTTTNPRKNIFKKNSNVSKTPKIKKEPTLTRRFSASIKKSIIKHIKEARLINVEQIPEPTHLVNFIRFKLNYIRAVLRQEQVTKSGNFRELSLIIVKNLFLNLDMFSDETINISISLENITVDDLRPERSVIYRIFERRLDSNEKNIIKATYKTLPDVDCAQVKVDIHQVVVCVWLEYIMELKTFFLLAMKRDKKRRKTSKKSDNDDENVQQNAPNTEDDGTNDANHFSTSSLSDDGEGDIYSSSDSECVEDLMSITVNFIKPKFIMVEDRSNLDCNCLVATTSLSCIINLSHAMVNTFVELEGFEIFASTFMHKETAKIKILDKTNLNVRYDITNSSGNATASLHTDIIQLYIFPSVINILLSIITNLSQPEKSPEAPTTIDFSKFWQQSSILHENFEFMKYANPSDMISESTSVTESLTSTTEIMDVSIEKFIVHVSDTHYGDDMFVLEGSMRGQVESWSTLLNATLNTDVEIGYYNQLLAVWEPLLEPIPQDKLMSTNQYRPYTFVIYYEKNPPVDDFDEIYKVPDAFNRIKITSIDKLNLTLTKRAMSMINHSCKIFNDAYNMKPAENEEKPTEQKMKFSVINISGLNIRLSIDTNLILQGVDENVHEIDVDDKMTVFFFYRKTANGNKTSFLRHEYSESSAYINLFFAAHKRTINAIKHNKYPIYLDLNTKVLVDVYFENNVQIVKILSLYNVHNLLPFPIHVNCSSKSVNNEQWQNVGECLVETCINLPVQHSSLGTHFRFTTDDGFKSETVFNVFSAAKKQIGVVVSKEEEISKHVNLFLKKTLVNSKSKDNETIYLYKLIVTPIMTFYNCLPFTVNLNFSLDLHSRGSDIERGETSIFFDKDCLLTTNRILFTYQNKKWSCRCDIDKHEIRKILRFVSVESGYDKELTLDLELELNDDGGYFYVRLYAHYWLINNTGRNLVYKSYEDKIQNHEKDDKNVVLMSQTKNAKLSIDSSDWSKSFSLDSVLTSGTIYCSHKNVEEEKDFESEGNYSGCLSCCKNLRNNYIKVGVSISLANFSLTKIIEFSPFCIITNNSRYKIKVSQFPFMFDYSCVTLEPGETNSLVLTTKEKKVCLTVAAHDLESNKSTCSAPFSPYKSNNITIYLDPPLVGLNMQSSITESKILITFTDIFENCSPWVILNHIDDYKLVCYQRGCEKDLINIDPNCFQRYTWMNHENDYELKCFVGSDANKFEFTVKLHDESDSFVINDNGHESRFYWISFLNGQQRILLITQNQRLAFYTRQVVELEQNEWQYQIGIKNLGLSLVDEIEKREISYISLTGVGAIWSHERDFKFQDFSVEFSKIVEATYLKSLQIEDKVFKCGKYTINFTGNKPCIIHPKMSNLRRTMHYGLWLDYSSSSFKTFIHMVVNKLQIDNQLKMATYNVALGYASQIDTKPFAEASIMMRKVMNSNIIQFKYFKVLIQEIVIKMDQTFLAVLMSFFSDNNYNKIQDVFMKKSCKVEFEENLVLQNKSISDYQELVQSDEIKNFYDLLHISPLKIRLTFTLSNGTTGSSDILAFMKNIGFLLSDVRDVCFKLGYFERNAKFYTNSNLLSEIESHYYQQAFKEAYALVLGLDVLGNPYGVLKGFAEGIEDLFYEPYKGAIQGPQEFFTGVASGVRSFIGHTIGGAADWTGRITGTFGKGISALSFDKKHQKTRRKRMNKTPNDFGEGITSGGKHLMKGIFDGVTGIITQPIDGARDEGAGGFIKGVGVGLLGIFTRPIGGLVDCTSSTLDGLKSTTEKRRLLKRIRPPRCMDSDYVIRPYNEYKAVGVSLLADVDVGKYLETDDYLTHFYTNQKCNKCVLATNQRIMYIEMGKILDSWNCTFEYLWSSLTSPPQLLNDKILIRCDKKRTLSRDLGKRFNYYLKDEAKDFVKITCDFYKIYLSDQVDL